MMFTGFLHDQLAGSTASSRCRVAAPSSDNFTPASAAASVAMTPAPPPLVSIVIESLVLVRKRDRVSAAKNSSCSVFTRNIPARPIAESNTLSESASAPVCKAAASRPCGECPAFTIITGLLRAAARAADMNLRGDVIDSAYNKIARVFGSLAR